MLLLAILLMKFQ